MAFFDDTFTEASDTTLASHTPDTGTSWTLLWNDGAAPTFSVIASSDRCKGNTQNNSGVIYTADATYPSADYEVELTLVGVSAVSTRPFFVMVRVQDVDNMYAARIYDGSNGVQLYKKVSGSWSTLGSPVTIAVGSVIKLQIIGSALKLFDDGAEVVSVTDSDISAAGKAAIGNGGGAELITSTDDANSLSEIDNFSIEDLGSGSVALVVQDSAHGHGADNVTLTQHNVLVAQDGTHGHLVDSMVLTQHNVLQVSDSFHEHWADGAEIASEGEGKFSRSYLITMARRLGRFM